MAAITALHDTMLQGRKLYMSKFVKKRERTVATEKEKFTNLYVKNLVDGITEDLLEERFSRYGKFCSVVIMKDVNESSRGFGFVNFQSPNNAKKAMEAMNGVQLGVEVYPTVLEASSSNGKLFLELVMLHLS